MNQKDKLSDEWMIELGKLMGNDLTAIHVSYANSGCQA